MVNRIFGQWRNIRNVVPIEIEYLQACASWKDLGELLELGISPLHLEIFERLGGG